MTPERTQTARAIADLIADIREPLEVAASYDVDGETVGLRLHGRDCKAALAALVRLEAIIADALSRVAEGSETIEQAARILREWAGDRQRGQGKWTTREQAAVECAIRLEAIASRVPAPPAAPEITPLDYEELDPGIRDMVRLLRDAGFDTTDSGDGVSKPADWYESGEAMPFQHVAASTTADRMIDDARRMAAAIGDGWTVEASFTTHDDSAILLARALHPGEVGQPEPFNAPEAEGRTTERARAIATEAVASAMVVADREIDSVQWARLLIEHLTAALAAPVVPEPPTED